MCNSFDIVRQQKVVAVFLLDFSLGSLQLHITWLIVALGTITLLSSVATGNEFPGPGRIRVSQSQVQVRYG